jgi:HEAT repeat protein
MTHSTGDHDLDRQLGGEPSEVAELLESGDGDTRARALGELISRGKRALPALLRSLKSHTSATRALAAEGLAGIADPSTADALAHALNDNSDLVRAQAAKGLANLDDPRALDALIKTLNDAPDVLHSEYSLSAYTLAGYGPRALPPVAPLLKSSHEMERAKAIFIIRQIASGMGAQDAGLKQALASYDPYGKKADRDKAADSLTDWIEKARPENEKAEGKDEDRKSPIDLSTF